MSQISDRRCSPDGRGGDRVTPCFVFILQPEFPINALILASEALRIANQNSGSNLFAWHYASVDGAPVRASNGMWMEVEFSLGDLPKADYLFLFEGNLPTQRNSSELLARLRSARRYGAWSPLSTRQHLRWRKAGSSGVETRYCTGRLSPPFKSDFPRCR